MPSPSTPVPSPARARLPHRYLLGVALLCSTEFMVVMDFSITTVVLEPIQLDLGFSTGHLQWVVNAYGVAVAALLLFGGRASDIYGRRRMFIAGLLTFTFASALGGFAQTSLWLIGTRALQGIGAALVSPAALSLLVLSSETNRQRAKAIGVWAAVGSAGFGAGLLAGGAISQYSSWRWVLWVNVPLGMAALIFTPFLLKETRAPRKPMDVPGALLATSGLLAIVFAIANSEEVGLLSPVTLACLVGGGGLLWLFAVVEGHTTAPLLPAAFLRQGTVGAANLVSLLANASLAAAVVILALHLSRVTGLSSFTTGLALTPMALALLVGSFRVAPVLLARLGSRVTVSLSLLLSALGLIVSAANLPGAGDPWVVAVLPATALTGFGNGLAYPAWTDAGVDGVPDRDQGLAAGVLTTSQEVGAAVGLALLTAVAASVGGAREGTALADGYDAALRVAAGIAVVGAIVAGVMFPRAVR